MKQLRLTDFVRVLESNNSILKEKHYWFSPILTLTDVSGMKKTVVMYVKLKFESSTKGELLVIVSFHEAEHGCKKMFKEV